MKSYLRMPDGKIYDTVIDSPIKNNFLFNKNDILYIWDVCDEEELDCILEKHGIPRFIVNDSFSYFEYSL